MAIAAKDDEKGEEIQTGHHEKVDKGPIFGARHTQTILMFLLLSVAYGMRVNLSVGIVAMTNSTTSPNPDIPTYNWNNKSVILSSFFWGYVILQVLAGEMAKKYGPKWLLVVAMTINSLGCIFTPLLADTLGSYGVMGCRVVQGLFQGFFFPSVHTILGKWAPVEERSMLGNIVFTGVAFGTIVAMPLTGIISASWVGWPVAFYIFGALGLLWCLIWMVLGYNSPAVHPSITPEEKKYIEDSLGVVQNEIVGRTPWKSIFTSLPTWAIIVANFGQNWGYATLLTEIPNYLSQVMGFNMKSNAWLSAAPYLALFIFGNIFGPLADYIIVKGYISRTNVRKIFNSIGTCGPAIALTLLGFVSKEQQTLSVVLLIIAVGINAGVFCGFQVNHVDLSPKFSGVLMGIGNGSSNIFSIISPLVVQAVVGQDEQDKTLWRTVFIIASFVYVASDIFYVIFATGERQKWDLEAEMETGSQNDYSESSTVVVDFKAQEKLKK